MLSALRTPQPASEKTKFKTVLGFSGAAKDTTEAVPRQRPSSSNGPSSQTYSRRSVDTVGSLRTRRKNRSEQSAADIAFFEDDVVTVPKDTPSESRNGPLPRSMPSRRLTARAETQEGPWAISVAETPHDATSYSLYVKSEFFSPTRSRARPLDDANGPASSSAHP